MENCVYLNSVISISNFRSLSTWYPILKAQVAPALWINCFWWKNPSSGSALVDFWLI